MNRFFATTILSALLAAGLAHSEEQTLFGDKGPVSHGGFGAPVLKVARIDGQSRTFIGGQGAWIVNHMFYLGGGGWGMPRGLPTSVFDSTGKRQYMHLGYGGVLLGVTLMSDRALHFGFENIVGAGGYVLTSDEWGNQDGCACGDRYDGRNNRMDSIHVQSNAFFVWEPQLLAEVNLTKWMRIAAGAGYRLTWIYEEKHGYKDNDLGGLSASLALKFGRF